MDNRLIQIAEHYGIDNQLRKLSEEALELAEAADDLARIYTVENFYHLAEEMADVWIMLKQIQYLTANREVFNSQREMKIERQLRRIRLEEIREDRHGEK